MTKDLQLSDSEWALMKILWEHTSAPVNILAEQAQESTQWHPKTVRTMLIRLHKKGIVKVELHDGVQHYQPCYSRAECELKAAESFLSRVFDGALSPMIAHFTRHKNLSQEDKAALITLLSEADKQPQANGKDENQ